MRKLFRKIKVFFGAKRYFKVDINGFVFFHDYITENQIIYIKDMATYMGFDSVSQALKNDLFCKLFADSGMDLNAFLERLIYTAYKQIKK